MTLRSDPHSMLVNIVEEIKNSYSKEYNRMYENKVISKELVEILKRELPSFMKTKDTTLNVNTSSTNHLPTFDYYSIDVSGFKGDKTKTGAKLRIIGLLSPTKFSKFGDRFRESEWKLHIISEDNILKLPNLGKFDTPMLAIKGIVKWLESNKKKIMNAES